MSALVTLNPNFAVERWMDDPEDFLAYHQVFAERVFLEEGSFRQMAVLLCRRNPKTGFTLPKPRVATVMPRDQNKDQFARTLQQLAKQADAEAMALMAEAWGASWSGRDRDALRAEAESWFGRVEHHPASREILTVFFQHRRLGTGDCQAEILRDSGAVKLGPWITRLQESNTAAEGRFLNILAPREGAS